MDGARAAAARRRRLERAAEREGIPIDPIIPDGHYVKGVSTLVDADGATVSQWVKTARLQESRAEILERLMLELPDRLPVREGSIPAPGEPGSADLLAVYPMGDPHIGMLSWAPETGEDFDLEIAQRIMRGAIDELVTRGPRTADALVINLGDFFHSNDGDNRTTSGHVLDVDGRWAKVLRVGLGILTYSIDAALTRHATVRVFNAIGNHDDHSAMFLAVALQMYYANEPRVLIEASPSAFHYHRFGKNLIGVTHGHMAKGDSLEAIMAADRAEDWGETEHRAWYCGHVHHTTRKEHRGCTVETFRTLAARDAWHTAKGYRAGRDMTRITLHERWGEVGRETVSAAYLQARFAAEAG